MSNTNLPYSPEFVTTEKFHVRLGEVVDYASDPVAGLFGPESMMWRLARHSAFFLGGWRAALLELAHPWVANAVDQHSLTREDPIGRFHRTFRNVFTIVFGSIDRVSRSAQILHAVHSGAKGSLSECTGPFAKGSPYTANEVHALLWVHATLVDTMVLLYELIISPLSSDEKASFYEESKCFAYVFGIPETQLPPTWDASVDYNERMWQSDILTVGTVGRKLGRFLFQSQAMPLSCLLMPEVEIFTAELMPPRLRNAFGLPPPSKYNQRRFERSVKKIKFLYPLLPPRLRYAPSYWEAIDRLHGRSRTSPGTRLLSRLWLEQPELVFHTFPVTLAPSPHSTRKKGESQCKLA